MENALKAIGLAMWGMIILGLLVIFIFVGYEAAVKFRFPSISVDEGRNEPHRGTPAAASEEASAPSIPEHSEPSALPSASRAVEATRQLLRSSSEQHQYQSSIEFGKQIYDGGYATPDDLLIVAQAYASLMDCANALTWANRANEAFGAAARHPDGSLSRIVNRCEADNRAARGVLTDAQREGSTRLLDRLRAGALADRKRLAKLEAEAQASESGELDVKLGEIYFGFADYEHAILTLKRGLEKRQIRHLDEAYVYLGRSEVAAGNINEAHKAFTKLKSVPDISPRVLRLWELYSETLQ